MNETCDVCRFLGAKPLKNQILTTSYWTVGVIPDQVYLGRALVTLLDHKGSLGQLSHEEWQEFESIVPRLENAYKQAFGAEPLNMGCYMNNGFKSDPPHPHVHWHVFPRYRQPYELKGIVFEDPRYGAFFDDDARRIVGDDVVTEIVQRLERCLE
jgi:diadenosine tetraphosphate (Ap4A) HIT family hydrolase